MVTLLPLAQLASVGGVYLLSWLLAILSACFALAAVQPGRARISAVAAALGLLTVTSIWGAARIQSAALTREGTPVSVGLIQANIPQSEKWDPSRARAIFQRYLQMTREAAAKGAQLHPLAGVGHAVLLPRRSDRPRNTSAVWCGRLARHCCSAPTRSNADRRDRYYNSAFMLDPAGATAAVYRKMFLVPFGEYVPFGDLLSFVGAARGSRVSFLPGHARDHDAG